jgi:hypothetical protein
VIPVELNPAQPEEVAAAVATLVARPERPVDPWWAAGLAEALGSGNRAPAQDLWGGAGVVEA